jgi:hypothetical protein
MHDVLLTSDAPKDIVTASNLAIGSRQAHFYYRTSSMQERIRGDVLWLSVGHTPVEQPSAEVFTDAQFGFGPLLPCAVGHFWDGIACHCPAMSLPSSIAMWSAEFKKPSTVRADHTSTFEQSHLSWPLEKQYCPSIRLHHVEQYELQHVLQRSNCFHVLGPRLGP